VSPADPPDALPPEQHAVLRHLVRSMPAARTARDVSRLTGLDAPTAARSLRALLRRGYVERGRPPGGAPSAAVAYLPTLAGLGYARVRP
jgi:DNA-binding MarR family transcriptional regulator